MTKTLWLIPLLPLLGALVNGLLGRSLGRRFVAVFGTGVVALAFVLAVVAFTTMLGAPGRTLSAAEFTWMAVGRLEVPFGLVVDPLSGLMTLVVTGIGTLIHLYSIGYMWEDEGFARFFAYLNLFVFFMLTLVLGSSLPLLFVGWEGVGLCSYLLIGYYFGTEEAPAAGLKAFLMNRVGDLGVVIGMMTLFAAFGTLTVRDMLGQAGHLHPEVGFGLLTFATLMLFVGATGKSAQIPLYLWLPDAMAGPTPVSALIHAATMVTAGIYLVCRLAPIFSLAPLTMNVIAWVGGATALFAATIGLVQRDIKKVLAYSTVSQLGYMFLGLGAAGFAAGFFHVFTHAFFKALLFLGAGSVIHGLHHQQDLFHMGGLRRSMPITFWTMVLATLAIIGFPGLAGFFSKDEILYLAYEKNFWLWVMGVLGACCTSFYMVRLMTLAFWGEPRYAPHHGDTHAHDPVHPSPQADRAASASAEDGGEHREPTGHSPVHHSPQADRAASAPADGGGEHREPTGHSPVHPSPQADRAASASAEDGGEHREPTGHSPVHHSPQADRAASAPADGGGEHREPTGHSPVHESPWSMTVPLVVLAVGSVFAGYFGVPEAFGGHFQVGRFLEPALTFGQTQGHAAEAAHGPAVLLALISTALGLGAAAWGFFTYRNGLAVAEARASKAAFLHRLLLNKYYVDEGVERFFLAPIRFLGRVLWKGVDDVLIDGLGIRFPAALTQFSGHILSLFQTGRVRSYSLFMTMGLLGLLWAFLR